MKGSDRQEVILDFWLTVACSSAVGGKALKKVKIKVSLEDN